MRQRLKDEIDEAKIRIEDLERQVADVRADSAAASHAINVQVRYASRVQNVARSIPPEGSFLHSMHELIDASRDALLARGK